MDRSPETEVNFKRLKTAREGSWQDAVWVEPPTRTDETHILHTGADKGPVNTYSWEEEKVMPETMQLHLLKGPRCGVPRW